MNSVLKQNRTLVRTHGQGISLLLITLIWTLLFCGLNHTPASATVAPPAADSQPAAETTTGSPPQIVDTQHNPSIAVAAVKAIGALAVIIGLLALLAAALKKFGLSAHSPHGNRLISVLDTKMIAPKKYVAVIDIAGQTMAIGVSEQQITLLTKLEPGERLQKLAEKPAPSSSFSSLLSRAVNRNKNTPEDHS